MYFQFPVPVLSLRSANLPGTENWKLRTSQLFYCHTVIGIDAHAAGDLHGFFGDLAAGELGVLGEGLGGGLGVGTSAADGGHAAVGLDDVALSAEQERLFFVADQQQGFEVAQEFIGAPVFGQFHGTAAEVAVILLELGFEAAEEGEGVGGGTGEAGQNFIVVEAADFFGSVLDDGLAEGDLAVAGEDDSAVTAHGKNCSGANN